MTSLTNYASTRKQVKCLTCQLPPRLREEVVKGREGGISFAVIARWLADEHSVNISKDAVRQHFDSRHDRGI